MWETTPRNGDGACNSELLPQSLLRAGKGTIVGEAPLVALRVERAVAAGSPPRVYRWEGDVRAGRLGLLIVGVHVGNIHVDPMLQRAVRAIYLRLLGGSGAEHDCTIAETHLRVYDDSIGIAKLDGLGDSNGLSQPIEGGSGVPVAQVREQGGKCTVVVLFHARLILLIGVGRLCANLHHGAYRPVEDA